MFSGAVDPRALNTLKPLDVAFRECMDKVDGYLETVAPREKILWIADTCRDIPRMKMIQLMQRIYTASNVNSDFGLGSERFQSHLIDSVYFGDSHESRALQLADVFCSVIAGHLVGDPIVEPYYEILERRIANTPVLLSKKFHR